MVAGGSLLAASSRSGYDYSLKKHPVVSYSLANFCPDWLQKASRQQPAAALCNFHKKDSYSSTSFLFAFIVACTRFDSSRLSTDALVGLVSSRFLRGVSARIISR